VPYPLPACKGKGTSRAVLPCWYLTFDSTPDDYVGLATGVSLTRPFTMVMWVQRRVTGVYHGLLAALNVQNDLCISNSNVLSGRHGGDSPGWSTVFTTTTWMHVAHVVTSAGHRFFKDGVDITGSAGVTNANTGVYRYIGRRGTGSSFDGQLAAIGIAPAELDIAALYAAGTFHKPLDPLVFTTACWNMRQETGTGTALVNEAVANHGTFKAIGEPAWGGLMSAGGPAGWAD
jgi:hypothetical protein